MKNNYILIFLTAVIVFFIFRNWFSFNPLSSGDWGFFYPNMLSHFGLIPNSWNNLSNSVGGENSLYILALQWYFHSTSFILSTIFRFPWNIIEKVIWFWPYILIGFFSSCYLFKILFKKSQFWFFSSVIFACNTYALMLVGGGQMGVAMAYSLAPLVLFQFILLFKKISLKAAILTGLILAIQIMFDIRIAYISLIAVFGLSILNLFNNFKLKYFLYCFVIPFGIVFLLHSFWIIPMLVFHVNPVEQLGLTYSSATILKFFSFAKFENTFSLLHPNWPENIFGKVYFMRPEFLFLPILAYISLLFIRSKEKNAQAILIFFAILGLLGAFLAKGANDPFGNIYVWLFERFPGFVMFRDPTKFYLLVALSYSILIPFSINSIYEWIRTQVKSNKYLAYLFLGIITLYLLFLISPAILGQLGGTFQKRTIPNDYLKLANFLETQKNFTRTLWVPMLQRYGYSSDITPAISAGGYLSGTGYKEFAKDLGKPEVKNLLNEASVGYVIVPYDSEKEIFLKDRKYDEKQYAEAVSLLRKNSWLKEIKGFGNIKVFLLDGQKPHFWSFVNNLSINLQYLSPTNYKLYLRNVKKGDEIIFSEQFDKYWEMKIGNTYSYAKMYKVFNEFILPKVGSYSVEITYKPQALVNLSSIISLTALVVIFGILLYAKNKKM